MKPGEEGVEIWLVRHGATEWSRDGRHTGITDLPLLPEGEEEARSLGGRLRSHRFARVLSSPLRRARDTAGMAGFGDRPEVTDLLREYDYGRLEGLTMKEIREVHPGWELFVHGCPGGESPADIAGRMERLLASLGSAGGDVLAFGHGHCLRALTAAYLGLPIATAGLLRLSPGALSILGTEHDHRALTLWNDTGGRW